VLTLDAVSVRYPGAERASLVEVSLRVPDGEVTGIAGASESGKTTLCLIASGLLPRLRRAVLTGSLRVDGADVAERPMHALAGRIGVLTGAPEALLSLATETVFEEVAFGPANLSVPREELIARVRAALAAVGLDGLEERDPRRLSTGQTQLVGIAASLAMGARNLVLDEPFDHLDPEATERLTTVLRSLAGDGAAILVASHDTRLLAATCDRVAVLDRSRLGPAGPVHEVLGDAGIEAAGLEPLQPLESRRP
jgi:energy-coupling factor transporter ATP-binding protein EcfA2